MHAGWMFLRTELRRRWRPWLALALIVGAFAGAVKAAAVPGESAARSAPATIVRSE